MSTPATAAQSTPATATQSTPTAAARPDPHKLLIAIVAPNKPDASLTLAVSLMNLQMHMSRLHLAPSLAVCDSFDAAMNAALEQDAHLLALDPMVGFEPTFVTAALESPHAVVSAVYPRGPFNWERVKTADASEPVQFRGNVYSAKPDVSGTPPVDGYARAATTTLGCVVVKRGVAQGILERHPENRLAGGGGRFAYEALVDGKLMSAHDTFAALYGKDIFVDTARPATYLGLMSFSGCVGQRDVLR